MCDSGQYLVDRLLKDGPGLGLTLGFVWNRNSDKLKGLVPAEVILEDLSSFANRLCRNFTQKYQNHELSSDRLRQAFSGSLWSLSPPAKDFNGFQHIHIKTMLQKIIVFYRRCNVIVEVCHPQIVREFGVHFLSQSHFMVRIYLLVLCGFWWLSKIPTSFYYIIFDTKASLKKKNFAFTSYVLKQENV